ncbi:MAG: alpha/beta hydrolase [Sphingobium sp.]|uniref:alpha/beta hydrolase n=1 Tax=Sphingobium sp. TaxID=1912891 RepID=UPI0029B26ED7|nr:alpha/beta hydrolase [Sphingobium sp.]MDX3909169.1 alpha/beta hydrolase [Sphingobium sp.]
MQQSPSQFRTWPEGGALDQWIAPDGWSHRVYRMGEGTRGQMLILAGRGDMIEKYLEIIAWFAIRGWAVTAFDWRGQGGSGRLGTDPTIGHVVDFTQWIEDLRSYGIEWKGQGVGPHVVLAHSMGGFLALRAMVEGALQPDAAVLTAPMLGLNSGRIPGWLARLIIAAMRRIAGPSAAAWTQNEASELQLQARQRRLTHCVSRHEDELYWRRAYPDLSLGAPSWNWLHQSYRATAALEQSAALERMEVPTLIVGTDADALVSPEAIRRVAARLPNATLHMYGSEAAHEILRETDPVRLDALARIDAFWNAHAPAA